VFVQVKNKRERSLLVRPPGVEKTSRLRSRDPVASGVKCGPHGGMNSKMKSWMDGWLSLKTKTEKPKTEVQQHRTGEEHQSDRCAMTQSGDFEAEDTCRDRKACVEAKQVCGRWASVRWSDDKDFRIRPREACIPN
jgi:hypothetical protein